MEDYFINIDDVREIVSYSRDWTVETLISQIQQGNIDASPKFQRRNVWTDERRSTLIESVYLNYPIPSIVLAEKSDEKGHFYVVDGKQRISTLHGFVHAESNIWKNSKLQGLKICKHYNGKTFKELKKDNLFVKIFLNQPIRVEILKNVPNNNILYDIFYRLNTNATELSTQDLRQVLFKGEFTNYLINKMDSITSDKPLLLHKVLSMPAPDPKREDDEIVLRFLGNYFYGSFQIGSLKDFLDITIQKLNSDWNSNEHKILQAIDLIDESIEKLKRVFKLADNTQSLFEDNLLKKIGRIKADTAPNKALFEVQTYAFAHIAKDVINYHNSSKFVEEQRKILDSSHPFYKTITQGTNSHYKQRFKMFIDMTNNCFGSKIPYPYEN